MIKVFPLGQASLLFKKEKTLVHIRLRYIIEIHSRHCFFWSNSWNLFFFFLNNFDLPNLQLPLVEKKDSTNGKEIYPFYEHLCSKHAM